MNPTFDRYYRQLGRATLFLFLAVLASYCLTVLFVRLDVPRAVISFQGATDSLAYAFAVLLSVFVAASVAVMINRWMTRRREKARSASA